MGLVTHFPTTDRGHDAIYTVVDRLSKFTYFIPCKHTVSAADLAQLFSANVVAYHGMSALIVSDRDPRFTLCYWHSLISALGCKHSLSTAFHPETHFSSEKMHRSIELMLHCYVSAQQGNWDLLLPTCEFALNSICSASTGISPAYVLFGCEPTLPLEHAVHAVTDGPVQSVTDCVANMESTLQLVRFSVTCSAACMANYANQHHCEVTFVVDSYACLSTDHLKLPTDLSRKLAFRYVGPFKVIDQINPVTFHLLLPTGWKLHDVFHVS